MTELLQQVMAYHDLGWCIIPIRRGTKRNPAIKKWKPYQTNRPDKAQLRKWFQYKNNAAVIMGQVSGGLACRDFDAMAEYEGWAKANPEFADLLPTVETAKGRHVYFIGDLEGIKTISNGELRGSRGYCLAPPSMHPSGHIYKWLNPPTKKNLIIVSPQEAGFISGVTEQPEQTEQLEAIEWGWLFDLRKAKETIPTQPKQRNRKIFDFAQVLKGLPEFRDCQAKELRQIVQYWHRLALPYIRTKDFCETWSDFIIAWDRVIFSSGDEPMTKIVEKATQANPPQLAREYYGGNKRVLLLVNICRELQKEAGEQPFFLSTRKAHEILGISSMQASRYLRMLETDEILKVVTKGGPKTQKATRFRYIVDS